MPTIKLLLAQSRKRIRYLNGRLLSAEIAALRSAATPAPKVDPDRERDSYFARFERAVLDMVLLLGMTTEEANAYLLQKDWIERFPELIRSKMNAYTPAPKVDMGPCGLSVEEEKAMDGGCSCHGYECNCEAHHASNLRILVRRLLSSTPPDPSSAKKYTPPDDESCDWWCTKNHRNGCHLQTCSVCGRKPGDTK